MAKPRKLVLVGFVLLSQLLLITGKIQNLKRGTSDYLDPTKYSWSVQIKIHNITSNKNTSCGGAIIADDAVISAAHCFYWKNTNEELSVEIVLPVFTKGLEARRVAVKSIKIHPEFNYSAKTNDITLLKTVSSMSEAQPGIQFLELPNVGYRPSLQDEAYIISYDTHSNLKKMSVRIASAEDCIEVYNQSNISLTFQSNQICGIEQRNRVFHGDSGSPLICKNNTFCGIVSFGVYEHLPDIYTNISFYLDWINSAYNENSLTEYFHILLIALLFIIIVWFTYWIFKTFIADRLKQNTPFSIKSNELTNEYTVKFEMHNPEKSFDMTDPIF